MEFVTVQLGQCGNQVGRQLFQTIADEISPSSSKVPALPSDRGSRVPTPSPASSSRISAPSEPLIPLHEAFPSLFRPSSSISSSSTSTARAVLVDMEPKVIQSAYTDAERLSNGAWQYSPTNSFHRQSGAGNNWAYGFLVHGPSAWDESVGDLIRKEAERCDRLGGFLLLQSLAGGTGSGLGAYVTQQIRDEPCLTGSSILNGVVWPHEAGEVAVQAYNATLSLSHLHADSDGLFVWQNDDLAKACIELLRVKSPSFPDMNRIVASHLSGILLPSTLASSSKKPLNLLHDLTAHLFSHPGFKFASIRSIPLMPTASIAFSSHTWSGLLKHLLQMVITDSKIELGVNWDVPIPSLSAAPSRYGNRSVASALFLRGQEAFKADWSSFANPALYTPWMRSVDGRSDSLQPLLVCQSETPFQKGDKTALIASNSQDIIDPLKRVCNRANEMLLSGAYVHQYTRHGLDVGEFSNSIAELDQVVASYQGL